jgi:hypothetical protein
MKICFDSNKIIFGIIVVVTFFLIATLNYLEPYNGDDLLYMTNLANGECLQGLGDVLESQVYHYLHNNGRAVVHFIDQLFLLLDSKIYFDFANIVVTFVLLFIIYFLCMGKRISVSFLSFEISLFLLCMPEGGSVLVWQTGCVNYLWGSVLLLLFFIPYLRYFQMSFNYQKTCGENHCIDVKKNDRRALPILCSALGGVIAGWTIEAGASMVLFGITVILICQLYLWKVRQIEYMKPQLWEFVGWISMILGFGLLCLAPGQMERAEKTSIYLHSNILVEILYRVARETYYMIMWVFPAVIALVSVMMLSKKGLSKQRYLIKFYSPLLCSTMAFVGIYVMTFSVGYAIRVLFTPLIFMIIAFGMFYKELELGKYETVLDVVSLLIFIMVFTLYATGAYQMYSTGGILYIHWSFV